MFEVFLIWMVNNEVSPRVTVLGVKNLVMLAPGRLVREAWAAWEFLAPLNDVTLPMGIVLVRLPWTFIVVLTVTVHLFPAARVPPLKVNVFELGTAVTVPPQVPVDGSAGLAMYIPAGMVSVKAIPVRGALFGLINWTLIVDMEPPNTVKGEKPLTTPRVRPVTVRFVEVSATGCIVPMPAIVPDTFIR